MVLSKPQVKMVTDCWVNSCGRLRRVMQVWRQVWWCTGMLWTCDLCTSNGGAVAWPELWLLLVLFIWRQTCDDYIYGWHFLNIVFGGSEIVVCFVYALPTCGQYVTVPVWWIHFGLMTEELTLICCMFSLDKYCFNLIVLSNFLWTGVSCYLSVFLFNHVCMQKLLQVYHCLSLVCRCLPLVFTDIITLYYPWH